MNNQSQRRFILAAGSILFALFIIITRFFSPHFHISDDVTLNSLTAGVYSASEPHLSFMHPYYGHVIMFLYNTFPSIPWYGLLLELEILLGWILLILGLSRILEGVTLWAVFALLFTGLGCYFFLNLHFSNSSGFLAACVCIFFLAYHHRLHGIKAVLLYLITLFTLLLSYTIREESAALVVVVFVPIFFFEFLDQRKSKLNFTIPIFLLSVMVLFGSLHYGLVQSYQKDPVWKSYREYFNNRGQFTDYNVPYFEPAAKVVGWSENDFYLLKSFFFFNEDVYSNEHMKTYLSIWKGAKSRKPKVEPSETKERTTVVPVENVKANEKATSVSNTNKKPIFSQAQIFYGSFVIDVGKQLSFLLVLPIILLLMGDRKKRLQTILFTLYTLVLIVAIAKYFKLPPIRVVIILLTCFNFGLIYFLRGNNAPITLFKKRMIQVLGFIFLGFTGYVLHLEEVGMARMKNRGGKIQSTLLDIRAAHSDAVVISMFPKFSSTIFFYPLSSNSIEVLRTLHFMPVGSLNSSPTLLDFQKKYNIVSMERLFIEDREVMVLSEAPILKRYITFAKEHYGIDMIFEVVNADVGLYKPTIISRNQSIDEQKKDS